MSSTMSFLSAASYFHSKLTFSLVVGDNAGKLFVVGEFKISQILKQCKLLACAQSHVKALSANFSSSYLAVKDVEKVNVCSSPLILAILKSDIETKLITWAPFLVHGEKWTYL